MQLPIYRVFDSRCRPPRWDTEHHSDLALSVVTLWSELRKPIVSYRISNQDTREHIDSRVVMANPRTELQATISRKGWSKQRVKHLRYRFIPCTSGPSYARAVVRTLPIPKRHRKIGGSSMGICLGTNLGSRLLAVSCLDSRDYATIHRQCVREGSFCASLPYEPQKIQCELCGPMRWTRRTLNWRS